MSVAERQYAAALDAFRRRQEAQRQRQTERSVETPQVEPEGWMSYEELVSAEQIKITGLTEADLLRSQLATAQRDVKTLRKISADQYLEILDLRVQIEMLTEGRQALEE